MTKNSKFISQPFTREIRTSQLLKLSWFENEILNLKKIIEERQSCVVIGPAGSGKTVLLRAVRDSLPASRYTFHYLKLSDLSARDMSRQVCTILGLESKGRYPNIVRAIDDQIVSGYDSQGRRQVIVFDDAQEMRLDTIRLIRLLTNFDMDSRLLVSIILSGQLSLKYKLLSSDLEDVRQRMTHCTELRLLTKDETSQYLNHRITIAGGRNNMLEPQAVEAFYELSKGNMRALDKIARASFEKAFNDNRETVTAGDVAAVRSELLM